MRIEIVLPSEEPEDEPAICGEGTYLCKIVGVEHKERKLTARGEFYLMWELLPLDPFIHKDFRLWYSTILKPPFCKEFLYAIGILPTLDFVGKIAFETNEQIYKLIICEVGIKYFRNQPRNVIKKVRGYDQ